MQLHVSSFSSNSAVPGMGFVPAGRFTTFREFPNSKQPARIRKLPVLQGFFDAIELDSSPERPVYVGWGELPLGDTSALTFRNQVGPNLFYWLVDPSDHEVWQALDAWDDAGELVLATEFRGGQALLTTREFDLGNPRLRAIRNTAFPPGYTARFLAEALPLVSSGGMNAIASSDISSVPLLRSVQACVVAKG